MSASTTVALRLAWSAAVPAFALAVLENRAESKARSSLMPHPSQEGRGLSLLRYLSFSCSSSRSRWPVGWPAGDLRAATITTFAKIGLWRDFVPDSVGAARMCQRLHG